MVLLSHPLYKYLSDCYMSAVLSVGDSALNKHKIHACAVYILAERQSLK